MEIYVNTYKEPTNSTLTIWCGFVRQDGEGRPWKRVFTEGGFRGNFNNAYKYCSIVAAIKYIVKTDQNWRASPHRIYSNSQIAVSWLRKGYTTLDITLDRDFHGTFCQYDEWFLQQEKTDKAIMAAWVRMKTDAIYPSQGELRAIPQLETME